MTANYPLDQYSIIVQSPEILSSNVDDETVLLSIKNSKYYGMAETGTDIWEMISSPLSVEKIVENLQEEYDIDKQQCLTDVLAYLEELLEAKLIVIK